MLSGSGQSSNTKESCSSTPLNRCIMTDVVRLDMGRVRRQLIESVVPYLNAARQIVSNSCQLVALFICVLSLVDLLSAVVWIYLRRSVFHQSYSRTVHNSAVALRCNPRTTSYDRSSASNGAPVHVIFSPSRLVA